MLKGEAVVGARKRIATILGPIVILAFLTALAWGLEPYFREHQTTLTDEVVKQAEKALKERRPFSFLIYDGFLVTATGQYSASDDGKTLGKVIVRAEIRWNILIGLFFSFALLLVFTNYWRRTASLEAEEEGAKSTEPEEEVSLEFLRVTRTTRRDADRQFLQARLMLVTGILVALAGVVVFATILDSSSSFRDISSDVRRRIEMMRYERAYDYQRGERDERDGGEKAWLERLAAVPGMDDKKLTAILTYREKMMSFDVFPPEPESTSRLLSHVLPAVRSFALFLALEAIAWFLLRQYRFAIADFKQLYRMYTRRESLFLAWQMSQMEEGESSGMPVTVLAALLQDDSTPKLLKDESTESLGELKLVEENPVTAMLKSVIGNWRSK